MERSIDNARARIVGLVEVRTIKPLKGIEILGNLSNRAHYSCKESDGRKIFRSLRGKLKLVEGRFLSEQTREKGEGVRLYG
jgi:hypothetical protein